jgi:hypothetical protein
MVRGLGGRAVSLAVACTATAALVGACGLHPGGSGGSATAKASSTSLPKGPSSGASFEPSRTDFSGIRQVLQRRTHAIAVHDQRAFMATVDDHDPSLVAQERTLYANLVRLGVRSLTYTADTSSLYVPAPVGGGDPTLRPELTESVRLPGVTTDPVTNPDEATFVKRDGHWLLGAENRVTDEDSYDAPQERPWFGAPIAVRRSGPLTVVMDAKSAGRLASLTTAVSGDISHDAGLLGVPPEYAVLVDATTNGTTHAMNGASGEDAAAVTKGLYFVPHGDYDKARVAGTVIQVNPETVDSVLAQPNILRHELTHYLLRQFSGSSPRWLVEGVAAWVQYYPDDFAGLRVPSSLYSQIMHADRRLPPEGSFYDAPGVDYPIGQAAVAWLVSHYGRDKLLQLMRAYRDHYQGVDIDPLTPQVLHEVYGVTPEQVVTGAFGLLAQFQH